MPRGLRSVFHIINDTAMRDSDLGKVQLIQSDEEFDSLETEWDGLYETSELANPFLSYAWAKAWRSSLCPESKLFILTYRRSGKLSGILALRLENRLGIRVLRFLVDGRADYLSALYHPSDRESPRMLYEALAQRQTAWDLAILRNWNDSFLDMGDEQLPAGLSRRTSLTASAPYFKLSKDWPGLVKTGPSQFRQAKRKAARFARDDGTVQFIAGTEIVDADRVVRDISDIESRSWKFATTAARFQSDADRRLLLNLLTAEDLRQQLHIWLAHFNGRPIAFLINFATPTRTLYYQGAYDADLAKHSPGAVLHYHAIHKAWQAGHFEYDFMMGDEAWKYAWTNGERILREHALTRSGLKSKATMLAFILAKFSRRLLKRLMVAARLRRMPGN